VDVKINWTYLTGMDLEVNTGNWFIVFSGVSPRTYVYIYNYIYISQQLRAVRQSLSIDGT
jgi:hypothetical protein